MSMTNRSSQRSRMVGKLCETETAARSLVSRYWIDRWGAFVGTPRRHNANSQAKSHWGAPRSGLTLLEIVLAIAIFFASLAALSQLAWNGSRAAVQARLRTQATIRCEAKLNEVLAGVEPMQGRSSVPFVDDASWTWSQVVTPSNHPELMQLDLTVSHRGTSQLANVDITLRRWARSTDLFAKAATQEKQEETAKAKPQ